MTNAEIEAGLLACIAGLKRGLEAHRKRVRADIRRYTNMYYNEQGGPADADNPADVDFVAGQSMDANANYIAPRIWAEIAQCYAALVALRGSA